MKWFLFCASILGFASVAFGAMGDHMMENQIATQLHKRWDTALHYHQLYSFVLMALGLYRLSLDTLPRPLMIAMTSFLMGLLFFSGSLYLSVFLPIEHVTYLTPVGGLLLMGGWLALAVYGFGAFRARAQAPSR